MVVAERQVHDRANGDGVVDDDRRFVDSAHAQDGHLWLVDDGCGEQAPERAGVRDRKGPALHLVGRKFLAAGAVGQVVDGARQPQKTFFVGMVDHRDDQAPFQSHGDAHVNVFLVQNVLARDGTVDDGEPFQGVDGRPDEKRGEAELRVLLAGEPSFLLLINSHNPRQIHRKDRGNVRRGAAAQDHMLGDPLPHGTHRDLFHAAGRHRRRCRG